jgi:hypothetical protein
LREIFRADQEHRNRAFVTQLSGDEEVPPRETRAKGNVSLKLSKDGTELSYQINVSKIDNVVAAHLHLAAEGENGPVVASLFGPVTAGGGRINGRLVQGRITATDLVGPLAGQPLSALLDQMEMGQIYVNVHTDDGTGAANTGPGDFAAGEIRGQVRVVPGHNTAVVEARGAVHDVLRRVEHTNENLAFVTTHLSGDEEVPPRQTRAKGNVSLNLNKDGTELSYQINVSKIDNVVAAHLHLGAEDENGPVVVGLFGPVQAAGGRVNGRLVQGTITAADLVGPLAGQPLSALLDRMEMGLIYVNVHTDDGTGEANTGPGDFAAGEIRGQVRVAPAPNVSAFDNFFAHWRGESLAIDWRTFGFDRD